MRVIEKLDAGIHFQKSELRNDYNRIIKMVDKEGKLFIDDRKSHSVAVVLSYGLYKELVKVLAENIEKFQDDADLKKAMTRASDGQEGIPALEFKKLLRKMQG